MRQFTWIVSSESQGQPATCWHSNGVSFYRVDEVKFWGIYCFIVISKPLAYDEEIEAVQMEGMALSTCDAGVLQNKLDSGVEWEDFHPRSVNGSCGVFGRIACVVEWE